MLRAAIARTLVLTLLFTWSADALADEPTAVDGPSTTDADKSAPPAGEPAANGDPQTAPAASQVDESRPVSALEADVRTEIPNLAYAYSSAGATAKTLGAMAYGLGVGAAAQKGIVGGGVTVWGAPIDRLTLIGDAQRDPFGNFAPSLAVVVRLLGERDRGWSLGALGKFKVEGFGHPGGLGTPPANKDEIDSELEAGLLLSYRSNGYHLDVNAITGVGLGDDAEVDTEGRLRLGYDVTRVVRIGVDGQTRVRLNGPRYLPNGRIWDFAAGPQAVFGFKHFFGALTGGPATLGLISDRVGWNVIASVGGTTF